ncbi:hypothetical protein ACPC54_31930 [Kitasatospora sp. NPDC094028]
MLVVNGEDDVHVPQHDTLVFAERRATRMELIRDTGHCAVSRLDVAMGRIVPWLELALVG